MRVYRATTTGSGKTLSCETAPLPPAAAVPPIDVPRGRRVAPASDAIRGRRASDQTTRAGTPNIRRSHTSLELRRPAGPRQKPIHAAPRVNVVYGLRPPCPAPCGTTTAPTEPSPPPDPAAQSKPSASCRLLSVQIPSGSDPRPTHYSHGSPTARRLSVTFTTIHGELGRILSEARVEPHSHAHQTLPASPLRSASAPGVGADSYPAASAQPPRRPPRVKPVQSPPKSHPVEPAPPRSW